MVIYSSIKRMVYSIPRLAHQAGYKPSIWGYILFTSTFIVLYFWKNSNLN